MIAGGHSFTDTAMTDGHLLSLERMNRVLHVDGHDVTVQAGIRLHELNEELATRGLAMPNLGDIDRQSIAGAISTATHGTGIAYGNLATRIVGLELVAGDGTIVRGERVGGLRTPAGRAGQPRCARGDHGADTAMRSGVQPARGRDDRAARVT